SNPPGEMRRWHSPQKPGQRRLGDVIVSDETEKEQSRESAAEAESCLTPGRGSAQRPTQAPTCDPGTKRFQEEMAVCGVTEKAGNAAGRCREGAWPAWIPRTVTA
ncbi:hypothetical protein GOODEAATRI_014858, partial [Goodea atripinnis]